MLIVPNNAVNVQPIKIDSRSDEMDEAPTFKQMDVTEYGKQNPRHVETLKQK